MSRSFARSWVASVTLAAAASLLAPIPTAEAQEPESFSVSIVGEAGKRIDGGGSRTKFAVDLPSGASCPGDSKDEEFRVNTYMVPVSVDPATLQFAGNGPEPQAYGDYETFRMPLFDTEQASVAARLTAEATAPGQPGAVVELPYVSLAVYDPGFVPEGTYNVGIVCNRFSDVTTVWNAEIVVTEDVDDPAQIRWDVLSDASPPRPGFPTGVVALGGGAVAAAVLWLVFGQRPNQPDIASKEPTR